MKDFVFARFLFTVRLDADFPDPYILYGIRSAFMQAFRTRICRDKVPCDMCGKKREECAYYMTFSQSLADDQSAVKRHQKPPLPFAFDFPFLPALPNKGHQIEIGLTLAGSALNYVAEYIAAMEALFSVDRIGRGLPGTIIRVESLGCFDDRTCLMQEGGVVALDNVTTISGRDLIEMKPLDAERIKLTISTPMRIIHDGLPVREFSCSIFLRSLLRRISSLTYYYYKSGHDIDYKRLATTCTDIQLENNAFRWSAWRQCQGAGHLSGILGSGYCVGRLDEELRIFLLLGEYFHTGKGAAFGLGSFRIET
ncbi:MAG TPA: CRISPR system precrRNA processing endoribonuclease RAMP protein Cas6 [Geobacteraceae bacterium]|nr:CRISPR system precrRNA processing endoribonuclease RAMP protein Cas6 [Geobacteraceae bacterium]